MPCDDCFDIDALLTANSILGVREAMTIALEALCGGRCAGELSTPGLNPIDDAADSIAEGFPDGLPDCECPLLVLRDSDAVLYFSADNGISWELFTSTIDNIAATDPTVNDDSGDGYTISSRWINTVSDKEFVCTDASLGAAVWVSTTHNDIPGLIELIPPTVLGATAPSIDIGSIPQDYRDLILVMRPRRDAAGAAIITMRFNNDSGTNYACSAGFQDLTTALYSHLVDQTQIDLFRTATGSSDTAGYFGHVQVEIFSYADASKVRCGQYEGSIFENVTNLDRTKGVFAWENLANPITSIQLIPSSGNFIAGTVYALYGRGTAP